jgi:hypothetical protein
MDSMCAICLIRLLWTAVELWPNLSTATSWLWRSTQEEEEEEEEEGPP